MRQCRFSLSMIREGGTQELVNQVDELFSGAPGRNLEPTVRVPRRVRPTDG
jgi:hypothetical protein